MAGVDDVIFTDSGAEMAELAATAIAADSPELRRERSERASSHSWEQRLREIEQALAAVSG